MCWLTSSFLRHPGDERLRLDDARAGADSCLIRVRALGEQVTVADVEKYLEAIKGAASEKTLAFGVEARIGDATAHRIEDEMRELVLQAVSFGTPLSRELARAALRSKEIEFSRGCM